MISDRRPKWIRGQALAETGIVIVMLVFLVAGVIEVGWEFMRASMIEHAARDGARWGTTYPSNRNAATGCLTSVQPIRDHVQQILNSVGFTNPTAINVTQACVSSVPTISVQITGTVNPLFVLPFFPSSFTVSRTVTFEDESRANPCASSC